MLGEFHRSLGLELSGPKNDRTRLAVMDFYPQTRRLILVDIEAKLSGGETQSADELLIEVVREYERESARFVGLAVHGPVSLPPYLKTRDGEAQPHPGKSRNAEVRWMNEFWEKLKTRPRPFLPYLQRPAEIWLRYATPEKFLVPDALGSNAAPLAARLHFLKPHFPTAMFEVFPRATMSRLVSSLGLPRTLVRDYSDLERGLTTREQFFVHLGKKLPQIFIYEKDLEALILHLNAFHAFLAALTAHLKFRGQCEAPPRGYPRNAEWIHLPRMHVEWDKVFS